MGHQRSKLVNIDGIDVNPEMIYFLNTDEKGKAIIHLVDNQIFTIHEYQKYITEINKYRRNKLHNFGLLAIYPGEIKSIDIITVDDQRRRIKFHLHNGESYFATRHLESSNAEFVCNQMMSIIKDS